MDKLNIGYGVPIGFQYVFNDVVSAINDLGFGRVSVSLAGDNEWNDLYFTPGTGSFKEIPISELRGGLAWKQEFAAVCTKDTIDEWTEVSVLASKKVIVRIIYKDGIRIVGTKDAAIRLVVGRDDNNGTSILISFSRVSKDRSCWEHTEQSGE